MVILHIASIRAVKYLGVDVAVPQHVRAQQRHETVGFVNLKNIPIEGIRCQFPYDKKFRISHLPAPFHRPDIVVFHAVYHPEYLSIAQELIKVGIPYIVIPHGSLTYEAQRKKCIKKWIGNALMFRHLINRAAAVQYLSNKERDSSPFGAEKFVGTNGIEVPPVCKEYLPGATEIKILYIGSLTLQIKGLDLMIEAFGRTSELLRAKNVRIALYGPNYKTRHADVKRLIEMYHVEDLITVNDTIIEDEKTEALLNADLFLQTSRTEGMPMGILEALSFGLPCIVTEGTNLRHFVEDNNAGWGAKNTAESIAEAIKQALENQTIWQEKSLNARAAIRREFDWDVVAKETVEVYRHFVKE